MKWFSHSMNLCLFVIALWSIKVVVAGNEEAKILFHYGHESNMEKFELNEVSEVLNHTQFDLERNTVFYLHGYIEKPSSPTVQEIIDAYTKRNTYNILILDWSTLADGLYPTAVRKSSELGPELAEIFLDLFHKGMNHTTLHIVGHSLGAHLAGQIGREITKKSNGQITLQRITGLDPAFPQYYPPFGGTEAISDKDAVLVDIIHTDKGHFGAPHSTGTVDFWPNGGGRFQPGCPKGLHIPLSRQDLCSHQRSVTLYAESVAYFSSTFIAIHKELRLTSAQMGIQCAMNSTPGDYSLRTNAEFPFAWS